jgi:hypothetical protein
VTRHAKPLDLQLNLQLVDAQVDYLQSIDNKIMIAECYLELGDMGMARLNTSECVRYWNTLYDSPNGSPGGAALAKPIFAAGAALDSSLANLRNHLA